MSVEGAETVEFPLGDTGTTTGEEAPVVTLPEGGQPVTDEGPPVVENGEAQPKKGDGDEKAKGHHGKRKFGIPHGISVLFASLFMCCPFMSGGGNGVKDGGKSKLGKAKEETGKDGKSSNENGAKLGEFKGVYPEVEEIFSGVEDGVKAKVAELKGGTAPEKLTVEGYRTQTVLGTNYFIKVKVDDGPDYVHVRVYKPVDGTPELQGVSGLKGESDEVQHFE